MIMMLHTYNVIADAARKRKYAIVPWWPRTQGGVDLLPVCSVRLKGRLVLG